MKKYASNVISLIFLFSIVYFFYSNPDYLFALKNISLTQLVLIIVFKTTRLTLSGLMIIISLKIFWKNINIYEATKLAYLTAFGNFFGPLMGGVSIKAIYLKKKYRLKYSHFVSVFLVTNIISYVISAFFGALVFLYKYIWISHHYTVLLFSLFMAMIAFVGLISIFLPTSFLVEMNWFKSAASTRFKEIIQNISNGLSLLKSNPLTFMLLFVVTFLIFLNTYFITLVELSIIMDSFSLINTLMYSVVSNLTLIISITPGGMGIKEGLLLFTGPTMDMNSGNVLQMSIIDRGVSVLTFGFLYLVDIIVVRTRIK